VRINNFSIMAIVLCLVGSSSAADQAQSETDPTPVVDATKALQDLLEVNRALVARITALENAEKARSALEKKKDEAEAEVKRLTAELNSETITNLQEREKIQIQLTQRITELAENKKN